MATRAVDRAIELAGTEQRRQGRGAAWVLVIASVERGRLQGKRKRRNRARLRGKRLRGTPGPRAPRNMVVDILR